MRPRNAIARRLRSEAETNNNVKIQRSRYAALAAIAERLSETRQKMDERRAFTKMVHMIDAEARKRQHEAPPRKATNHKNPDAPASMYELYLWFKAKGELDYFFANICRDPRALTP